HTALSVSSQGAQPRPLRRAEPGGGGPAVVPGSATRLGPFRWTGEATMLVRIMSFLWLLATLPSGVATAESPGEQREAVQGAPVVSRHALNGRPAPEETPKGRNVLFSGDKRQTLAFDGKAEFQTRQDEATDPKPVTATPVAPRKADPDVL